MDNIVERCMKALNLNITGMAAKLGAHPVTVRNWRNGTRTPGPQFNKKLERILKDAASEAFEEGQPQPDDSEPLIKLPVKTILRKKKKKHLPVTVQELPPHHNDVTPTEEGHKPLTVVVMRGEPADVLVALSKLNLG